MEAGAAERAAHGQRRQRVTDWPLMGASEYKHVVLGPIFLSTSRTLSTGAGRSCAMSSPPTGSPATLPRSSSSPATSTLLRACSG
jgi:hypothetical protein